MNCTATMKPYAQEAEVLRLLLENNCISGEKVIAWADEMIIAEKEPSGDLIELSTTLPSKTYDICSKLSELAHGTDSFGAVRLALGRMYEVASTMSPSELRIVASSLNKIVIDHHYNLPEDLNFLFGLSDEFSMIAEGYADPAVVQKEFLDTLKHFWNKNSAHV